MRQHLKEISTDRELPAKADTFTNPKATYIAYIFSNPEQIILHHCSAIQTLKSFSSVEMPLYEW